MAYGPLLTSAQVVFGNSGGRSAHVDVGPLAHISRVVAFAATGQKYNSALARTIVHLDDLQVLQNGLTGEAVMPAGGGVTDRALFHAVLARL
jgi:hypothetical protein